MTFSTIQKFFLKYKTVDAHYMNREISVRFDSRLQKIAQIVELSRTKIMFIRNRTKFCAIENEREEIMKARKIELYS